MSGAVGARTSRAWSFLRAIIRGGRATIARRSALRWVSVSRLFCLFKFVVLRCVDNDRQYPSLRRLRKNCRLVLLLDSSNTLRRYNHHFFFFFTIVFGRGDRKCQTTCRVLVGSFHLFVVPPTFSLV